MTERLAHRGPDAEGVIALGPIAMGHRRLSVIDVSETNNQPFLDSSGSVLLVYNGEIYNFLEIRVELEKLGARFRTNGDTEVVAEAYKHWGVQCLERFNGMFAFALWDVRRKVLLLARDRIGEKPLFFSVLEGGDVVFASEPKAFRDHPGVDKAIDEVALSHYLTLNYTTGERTLMRGVRRLAAGHCLVTGEDRSIRINRYWDLARNFRDKRHIASETDAAEELAALIDDSVRLRLVSDVPLGAFLSGGIDSSTVVSSMTRSVSPGNVRTFSVGFGERSFDEVEYARAVAGYLGVDHKDRVLRPDPENIVRAIVAAADEPLADSSVLPTYFLAAFAREHVTVSLSGDGGDECFAGYETYAADRLHRYLSWVPERLVAAGNRIAGAILPVRFEKVSFDYKVRHFLAGLHLDFRRAHFSWRNIFGAEERRDLMRPEWVAELAATPDSDPFREAQRHFEEVSACHYLDQACYVDIKTWLADDILVKVDRATMAHSLESRAPFLDHRLVEFAASLPVSLKMKGFAKKYLLKRSQRNRLPRWVLRRRKQGFNAPVTQWLNGPLRSLARDALATAAVGEWFRREQIERLWREQDRGQKDNGLKLFGLLCFSLWLNQAPTHRGRVGRSVSSTMRLDTQAMSGARGVHGAGESSPPENCP